MGPGTVLGGVGDASGYREWTLKCLGGAGQCTSSEPQLRPLQNGDKRFMIQSHKHAYSRDLINVRFCDDLIQLWPSYLHFSERKKHRELEELS